MSKAVEDFYEFTQSKLMTYAREQDLKCSGELVLYVRIKGRDVRKAREIRWWRVKEARESTVGKSPGLNVRQNEEIYPCFTLVGSG